MCIRDSYKELNGTPEEEAKLKESYAHLCTLRDEVIEMGVLPAIKDWHKMCIRDRYLSIPIKSFHKTSEVSSVKSKFIWKPYSCHSFIFCFLDSGIVC